MVSSYLNTNIQNTNSYLPIRSYLYITNSLKQLKSQPLFKIQDCCTLPNLEKSQQQISAISFASENTVKDIEKLSFKQKVLFKLSMLNNKVFLEDLDYSNRNNLNIFLTFSHNLNFHNPYDCLLESKFYFFNFLVYYYCQIFSQSDFVQTVKNTFTLTTGKTENYSESSHNASVDKKISLSTKPRVLYPLGAFRDNAKRKASPFCTAFPESKRAIPREEVSFFHAIFPKNKIFDFSKTSIIFLKTKSYFTDLFTKLFFVELNQCKVHFNSSLNLKNYCRFDLFSVNYSFFAVHPFLDLFLELSFKEKSSLNKSNTKVQNSYFTSKSTLKKTDPRINTFFASKKSLLFYFYNLIKKIYVNPSRNSLFQLNLSNSKFSINQNLRFLNLLFFSNIKKKQLNQRFKKKSSNVLNLLIPFLFSGFLYNPKALRVNSEASPDPEGRSSGIGRLREALTEFNLNKLRYKEVFKSSWIGPTKNFKLLNLYLIKYSIKFLLRSYNILIFKIKNLINSFRQTNALNFCIQKKVLAFTGVTFCFSNMSDLYQRFDKYQNKSLLDDWSYFLISNNLNTILFLFNRENLVVETREYAKWNNWFINNVNFSYISSKLLTKNDNSLCSPNIYRPCLERFGHFSLWSGSAPKSTKFKFFYLSSKKQIKQELVQNLFTEDFVKNPFLIRFKTMVKNSASLSQSDLILKLSPFIYCYSYYLKNAWGLKRVRITEKEIFNYLWKWACRRHNNKSKKWIQDKYFYRLKSNIWLFGSFDNGDTNKVKSFLNTHIQNKTATFFYLPLLSQTSFHINKSLKKNSLCQR